MSLWAPDFEAAGFKRYVDSFKRGLFYVESWQKRVTDEFGTRYFVNVDLWEWPDDRRSVASHVQFYERGEARDAINVERLARTETVADIEAAYASIWERLNLGWYEKAA